jgi:hypothetical protein
VLSANLENFSTGSGASGAYEAEAADIVRFLKDNQS